MPNFFNGVIGAANADFTRSSGFSSSESNGLVTDGELWIGSTATNIGGTHVNVGNLTSPNNSITFGYNSPNITAIVNTGVVQDLHTARYIVSAGGLSDGANYTTIAAAYAAAAGTGTNQTVFIQPGTYTENLTLTPGVNLCAYDCDAPTPNVTIVGKCTLTTAGTVSISGIRLQTNSDFVLAVTGSAASIVNLINCFLNCTNNTGITFTSSSASSVIQLYNCSGNLTTTGIAFFAANSAGQFLMRYGKWSNSGNSTTANTVDSSGFLEMAYLPNFTSPVTSSGTAAVNIYHSRINSSPTNTTAYTQNSTATNNSAYFCRFDSGSASALNIASGTFILDFADVGSSNANAITGAGTIKYGRIVYSGSSFGNNVTTKTALTDEYGIMKSTLQPAFLATHTVLQSNVTGNGTAATVNFTTEIFDQNSDYDGTNTFTAPITGRYQFNAAVNINDGGASTARASLSFVTSNRTYVPCTALAVLAGVWQLNGSILADMDAGDTCIVQATANGVGADTADFPANASNSYFSGYLVC